MSTAISQYVEIFRCPICQSAMRNVPVTSLVCNNHHCFDLSKHGYVHLATRTYKTKYDKQLFAARRAIMEQGFFDPLYDVLSEVILHRTDAEESQMYVLDAGCGEGYHLTQARQRVMQTSKVPFVGVGVDLAKEGVMLAAKSDPEVVWCVGDLTNAPFVDRQFSCILNLLSPSNSDEFHRLLADDGRMIKVIPEANYLRELREALYQETPKTQYKNTRTIEHFKTSFQLIGKERVQYQFRLEEERLVSLLQMTPLAWGATPEQLKRVSDLAGVDITIDLAVLIGRK
ncbi:methyltransferase domain-containing protein [Brevibacillus sp. M2.1A]|uniref:putative RNA methyltransferase n=1 Tax=Brevibacillus sp. M2.1A TaxID=2738980 RepID=UPI001E32B8BA|nr:methyltransferase domain-containing protein [Brevibacillus sp. M2.1A]MCC8437554.1 methyltransferase domain-containing protein [Brevibacillus sp. M2.1A]